MIHINVFLHNKLLKHRASVVNWPYFPPTHQNKEFVCASDRRLLWTTGMQVGKSQEKGSDNGHDRVSTKPAHTHTLTA